MMKIIFFTASLMMLTTVSAIADNDQTNMSFDDGSVIIHCAAQNKDAQLDTAVFNEAFPLWITRLQALANEGRVARAHYLNELKQGIFIVVPGKNPKDAMENALAIQSENQAIMRAALEKAGLEADSFNFEAACELIEIGPVAILPTK